PPPPFRRSPSPDGGGLSAAAPIFALATPPGRGAIAIIRLSGSGVSDTLTALGAGGVTPRMASLRSLTHDGAILDQALVLWFSGPHSYTGEDCAELHLHGGRA